MILLFLLGLWPGLWSGLWPGLWSEQNRNNHASIQSCGRDLAAEVVTVAIKILDVVSKVVAKTTELLVVTARVVARAATAKVVTAADKILTITA